MWKQGKRFCIGAKHFVFLLKWIGVTHVSNAHMDRDMRIWYVQVWIRTLSRKEINIFFHWLLILILIQYEYFKHEIRF